MYDGCILPLFFPWLKVVGTFLSNCMAFSSRTSRKFYIWVFKMALNYVQQKHHWANVILICASIFTCHVWKSTKEYDSK